MFDAFADCMIDTLLTGLTLRRRFKALSDNDYADKLLHRAPFSFGHRLVQLHDYEVYFLLRFDVSLPNPIPKVSLHV